MRQVTHRPLRDAPSAVAMVMRGATKARTGALICINPKESK
jgi:hypothetical protein